MKRLLVALTAAALLTTAVPAGARPDIDPCCKAGTSGKVAAPNRPLPIVKSCCQAGTRGNAGIFVPR